MKIKQVEVLDETYLQSKLNDPVSVLNAKGDFDFTEILSKYVLNGSEYELWEVDEETREALFFQKVKDNPIYFSRNAMLRFIGMRRGSDKLRAKYVG